APRSSPAPHSDGHHFGPMGVSGPSGFFSSFGGFRGGSPPPPGGSRGSHNPRARETAGRVGMGHLPRGGWPGARRPAGVPLASVARRPSAGWPVQPTGAR